jgi:sRNA-binding protein
MTEEELRSRWPQAFNSARLPLAFGIQANMGIAYGDNKAMENWVLHPKYLRNMLVPGTARVDLTGAMVGTVTQEERERAWRALLEVRDWIWRQRRDPAPRWLRFSQADETEEMKHRIPNFQPDKNQRE